MRYQDMPELRSASLLGNLRELIDDRLNFLRQLSTAPPLLRGRALQMPLVFANTPELCHEVLVTKAPHFEKSPGFRLVLHYLAGQGLFTSEGDLWKRQRKLMAPIFQPSALGPYGRTMTGCARRAVERWRDGETIDLAREMTRVTMAVVGDTLFGADTFDEADSLGEALTDALQWTSDNIGSPMVGAHIALSDLANDLAPRVPPRLLRPYHRLQDRLREPFLMAGSRSPRLQAGIERLDARMQEMIDERRRATAPAQADLLTRLLRARDDEDGLGAMSDRQVRDEAITLFVAGHETTATALAWAFYLLARHPDALARAQAEADGFDDERDTFTTSRLPYLTRVFKEALRLYPPVVILPRRTLDEVAIGGYTLAPRTLVFVNPYTIHHRPDVYPDPDRFDPDRWLPEREASRPRSSFLPFGAGPRVCIGIHFALMEGPLILATILRRTRLAIDPRREIIPGDFATIRPAGGVPAVVTRVTPA